MRHLGDIKTFHDLQIDILRDYQLFLCNFSFQKVKNTFIQDKSKYIEVLDKYIVTIQNILLSIPLSVGLTFLIKVLESDKKIESTIIAIAFILYSVVSLIIVKQNDSSLQITERLIMSEKIKMIEVETCSGQFPDNKDFSEYFDIFEKKIFLVKVLSVIMKIILIALALFFVYRMITFFLPPTV
jgi:hypothetical protein